MNVPVSINGANYRGTRRGYASNIRTVYTYTYVLYKHRFFAQAGSRKRRKEAQGNSDRLKTQKVLGRSSVHRTVTTIQPHLRPVFLRNDRCEEPRDPREIIRPATDDTAGLPPRRDATRNQDNSHLLIPQPPIAVMARKFAEKFAEKELHRPNVCISPPEFSPLPTHPLFEKIAVFFSAMHCFLCTSYVRVYVYSGKRNEMVRRISSWLIDCPIMRESGAKT